jgi:hypothetical protein
MGCSISSTLIALQYVCPHLYFFIFFVDAYFLTNFEKLTYPPESVGDARHIYARCKGVLALISALSNIFNI